MEEMLASFGGQFKGTMTMRLPLMIYLSNSNNYNKSTSLGIKTMEIKQMAIIVNLSKVKNNDQL